MNAVARPVPMAATRAVTFQAWFNSVPVTADWGHEAAEKGLVLALTIQEAVAAVEPFASHKAFVSIRKIDSGRNKQVAWFFTAKKSTRKGRWRDALDGGPRVFEGKIELHCVGEMEVNAFEPTPPFRVTRETTHAEIVGHDLTLVDVR